MIDSAREKLTTASSSRYQNPTQPVTYGCNRVLAQYEGLPSANPGTLASMEGRTRILEGIERRSGTKNMRQLLLLARPIYELLGASIKDTTGIGIKRDLSNPVEGVLAKEHPELFRETPYDWCVAQFRQYRVEISDGNPRGLDIRQALDLLREGETRLRGMQEIGEATEDDMAFYAGLFDSAKRDPVTETFDEGMRKGLSAEVLATLEQAGARTGLAAILR